MYKDLSQYQWINKNPKIILDIKNFEVIINPKIKAITKISHYEYEECESFKLYISVFKFN